MSLFRFQLSPGVIGARLYAVCLGHPAANISVSDLVYVKRVDRSNVVESSLFRTLDFTVRQLVLGWIARVPVSWEICRTWKILLTFILS